MRRLFFFITFFLTLYFCNICHSQTSDKKNLFSINTGYPYSDSKDAFIKNWNGITNIEMRYNRNIFKNISGGTAFNYSLMNFKTYDPFNPSMPQITNFRRIGLNPNLFICYSFSLYEKITFNTYLDFGYTFLKYKNLSSPNSDLQIKQNSGFNIKPNIHILYKIKNNLLIGLYSSYNIIFESVRTPPYIILTIYEVPPAENKIKTFNIGLSFGYQF